MADNYEKGQWNAVCDVCGFEFKAKELKKRWDGFMVCKEDFEVRHSLDFQRAREERVSVPWTRTDDSEGEITAFTTDQTLTADIDTDTIYLFNTDSGNLTCTIPAANDSGFAGVPVLWTLLNTGSNTLYVKITLTQWGGTDIAVPTLTTDLVTTYLRFALPEGVVVKIRNNPTTNLWHGVSVVFGGL